jgi:hypothetical protein
MMPIIHVHNRDIIAWIVYFITGWALSPVFFGKMLDSACHIWQIPCSSSGACELYDLRLFRLSIHGLSLGIRCLSLVFLCCLMVMTRHWKDWKFSTKNQISKEETGMKYTPVPSEDIKNHKYIHVYSLITFLEFLSLCFV